MSEHPVALRNVRVFDGDSLTEPRTVVIDGTVFGRDDEAATSIDAGGATLLPGLIDAHVHLSTVHDLEQLARWGVTTTLDMGCWPRERVAELRGATNGRSDFRTAGLPAIGPSGPHSQIPGMPREAIALTPDEARRHVDAQVADGVDYIKAIAEAPGEGGPTAEVLAAVVAAAREHGLSTVIHAATVGAYAAAVECGAEFVTHAPVTGVIRDEDVAALVREGRTAIPTAVMLAGFIASGQVGAAATLSDPLASIGKLHGAGVTIVAGSDSHSLPGAPIHVPHGESLHKELELLVEAGLSNAEALRAATSTPARHFGLEDRGSVAPGLRADLVLLDGDPLVDIRATRDITAVWVAGEPVADLAGGGTRLG